MLDESLQKLRDGVRTITKTVVTTANDAALEASDLLRESAEEVRAALPKFEDVLSQALVLPGVGVDRAEFLSTSLRRQPLSVVACAIELTPQQAGISLGKLSRAAGKALGKEARRTTVVSIAAGVPGGAAAAATIPADLIQFYGHLLRAIQMLSYLYGWGDTCRVEGGATPMATKRALILFLGAMAGDERAEGELVRLAPLRGTQTLGEELLVEGVVEQVGDGLEARMAHRMTGQVMGKSIPLAGAVISGTLSYGGFSDMWKHLRAVLEGIERQ